MLPSSASPDMRCGTRARRRQRGSASVELVVVAPLVGLLLVVVVAVGRVQVARADLAGAARAAARELSLARDPEGRIADVRASLEATLNVGSPTCRHIRFEPVVSPAEVTVALTCVVDVDGSGLLPLPATLSLQVTATEVIDQHREAR